MVNLFRKPAADYHQIFRPGNPTVESRYLVGRQKEIKELREILDRPGQHVLLYGDRGIGKTSLARHVIGILGKAAHLITCTPGGSFSEIFSDVVKEYGYTSSAVETSNERTEESELRATPAQIGGAHKKSSKSVVKEVRPAPSTLTSRDVLRYLREYGDRVVIFLDEYDSIGRNTRGDRNKERELVKQEFDENVVFLMKQIADHGINAHIVVIGVAYGPKELLRTHESIHRSLKELRLSRVTSEDLSNFLTTAEADLGMRFENIVRSELVATSMGYPYYVHAVGQESISAMLDRDPSARIITPADFREGFRRAFVHEYRYEAAKYSVVERSLTDVERIVLMALAKHESLFPSYEEILQAVESTSKFSRTEARTAIEALATERRFIYVWRHQHKISFNEPLMKAFLRQEFQMEKRLGRSREQTDDTPGKQLLLFGHDEPNSVLWKKVEDKSS